MRTVAGIRAFAAIFSTATLLFGQSAIACILAEQETDLLWDHKPASTFDASFVGHIKIEKVNREYPITAIARVTKSDTHPQYVGETIALFYVETSCGPRVKVGDSGFVIGESLDSAVYQKMVVMPYKFNDYYDPYKVFTEQGIRYLKKPECGLNLK